MVLGHFEALKSLKMAIAIGWFLAKMAILVIFLKNDRNGHFLPNTSLA